MKKANYILEQILSFFEIYVCSALFFITCAIIFIQVVFRAVNLPVSWTEEYARYLCIWVIYLAASRGVKNNSHMSVDLLPMVLNGKSRVVLYIIANIISLGFFGILCCFGTQFLLSMNAHPQYSAATSLNMRFAYAAPYVGAAMMSIRGLQNLIILMKQLFGIIPMEKLESEKIMQKGRNAE